MTISSSETRVPDGAPSEGTLARLWAEVLGAAPERADQDFFASGGDSIQAAALVARVAQRTGADVSLGEFVAEPTVAALARCVQDAASDGRAPLRLQAAPPADSDGAQCSYGEERFWFIDQATESNPVSNVPWALRLRGEIDAARLESALDALVQRHEILRTRFAAPEGRPVALVDRRVTCRSRSRT